MRTAEQYSTTVAAVSYTHLDVYKRQVRGQSETIGERLQRCLLYTSRCV
ncbi:hypothetical protein [Sphingobium sp. B2]|nr:hypothetical protein [Sphingobium sp. B2]